MTRVRVRLLGPVRLEVDGRAVTLGAQLRLVLAVLALERGRPVTAARLAALLWADPPDAAGTTVRSHVAHLRRAVEPGRGRGEPPSVLVTEPSGYALRLGDDALDLAELDRHLAAADAATAARADAAGHLAAALRLWHGPALADVADRPFAVAEAARLAHVRADVSERLADAHLAAGRATDAVATLTPLVAERPADERLRERLATALWHAGRADDAAAACADGVRLRLADGLGSPALTALHTRILRAADGRPGDRVDGDDGDAGGRGSANGMDGAGGATADPAGADRVDGADGAGTRVRPRPFQAPPALADLTGRSRELAAVLRLATAGDGAPGSAVATPVVAVDGKPGVGKSALVVHAAHRLAPRHPGGVLYADLRGGDADPAADPGAGTGHRGVDPFAVLSDFLRALGERPPLSLADAVTSFRSATRGVLVVLDNAVDAAQVRPLVPTGPGCAALVTSRRPLVDLDGAATVTLDLLSRADAVALLARLGGRNAADPALRLVARRCGLLPLALRIAAARLRARPGWSVAAFAERLADERRRLSELRVGDLDVRSSFLVGHRALRTGDARLFELMGLLDAPTVGVGVVAALAGVSADAATTAGTADVEAALERLVDAQLVESPSAGRYRFHDLLRLFAREQAAVGRSAAEREAAVARALRWWRDAATGPYDDAERPGHVAAAWQAVATPGAHDVAGDLVATLTRHLVPRGHWADWSALCHAALAAAERAGDVRGQGVAHRYLSSLHNRRRRDADAQRHVRRSLELFEACGDRHEHAWTLLGLGVLHGQQGRLDDAAACFADVLAVAEAAGDGVLRARALNNVALVHAEHGRHDAAVAAAEAALAIVAERGDPAETSNVLDSLGAIHRRRGDLAAARDAYRRSAAAAVASGDKHREAVAELGLGAVAHDERGPAAARPHRERALALFTELDAPEAGDVRALLGRSRAAHGPAARGADTPADGPVGGAGQRPGRGAARPSPDHVAESAVRGASPGGSVCAGTSRRADELGVGG